MHIGHDEVGHVNAFPATPQQRAVGFGKLFLDDVTRIHDHLAALEDGPMRAVARFRMLRAASLAGFGSPHARRRPRASASRTPPPQP